MTCQVLSYNLYENPGAVTGIDKKCENISYEYTRIGEITMFNCVFCAPKMGQLGFGTKVFDFRDFLGFLVYSVAIMFFSPLLTVQVRW